MISGHISKHLCRDEFFTRPIFILLHLTGYIYYIIQVIGVNIILHSTFCKILADINVLFLYYSILIFCSQKNARKSLKITSDHRNTMCLEWPPV